MLAVEPDPNPLWDLVFGRASRMVARRGWRRRRFSAPFRRGLARRTGARRVRCSRRRRRRPAGRGRVPCSGGARRPRDNRPASGWPSASRWPAPRLCRSRWSRPMLAEAPVYASNSKTPVIGSARSIRPPSPAAPAASNATADVGEIAIFVADEGDDPIAQAASLLADLAARRGGRCAPTDNAMDRNKRGAASRAERCLRWRGAASGRRCRGRGLGFCAGAAQRDPGFCRCGSSIFPPGWTGPRAAARSREELAAANPETEIVWTRSGRHVPRLRRGLPPRWAAPGDMLALDSGPQGGIDGLQWRPIVPRPPGPGEVSIDVHAAGLNFRDVMWGMGLLPEEALIDGFAGPTFGLECAGIVREVGRRGRGSGGRRPGGRVRARRARDARHDRGARALSASRTRRASRRRRRCR